MNRKFLYLVFFFTLFLVSCGGEEEEGPTPVDPLDEQANLLNATWKVKDANSVTKDGTIVDVFTNLTLTNKWRK